MSHQTAETQYIQVNGVQMAYRRIGNASGIPLVLLMHYRGNMDFWDPALINALARNREVILLDNAGIGRSGGEIPVSISGWADVYIQMIRALNIKQIDLLGFSMGGGAAQMVALNAHGLVRKLILAGTRASKRPSTVYPSDWKFLTQLSTAVTAEEQELALAESFHPLTPEGIAVARASWLRINERKERAEMVDVESAKRQIAAFADFDRVGDAVHHLSELTMPVMVANGDNDVLIPSINSWDLLERLPNAYLHIYPNAGHGFLFQYAELFTEHVNLFLDRVEGEFAHKL